MVTIHYGSQNLVQQTITKTMRNWLLTLGIMLLILWGVAHFGFGFNDEIHVVLVAAIILLLFQLISVTNKNKSIK